MAQDVSRDATVSVVWDRVAECRREDPVLSGPWRAIHWTAHAAVTVVWDNGLCAEPIAECRHPSGYCAPAEPIARLVAAAPDLLREARAVLLHLERQGMGGDLHLAGLRRAVGKAMEAA